MDFVWFNLKTLDSEGKEQFHPLYQGTERISEDGTMFMMHVELLPPDVAIPKTSVMPTRLTKSVAPLCMKDETQTRELMQSDKWTKAEVIVKEVVGVVADVRK
jgi:hypothetical protein